MDINRFQIKKILSASENDELYTGLRDLWVRVFGDSPDYVDGIYRNFGSDVSGYVAVSEGKVVAALTCYKCGELTISDFEMNELCGKPVYVSYAVCTDPEYRGLGIGGMLTEYVRDIVVNELGGLSLVSPAEPSLEDFYREHGYRPFFYVDEVIAAADMDMFTDMDPDYDDDYYDDFYDGYADPGEPLPGELWADVDSEPFEPELNVQTLDSASYNRYREAYLCDDPHVILSDAMMELASAESLDGDGLLAINGGDAICAVSACTDGRLFLTELLVNPMLLDISSEIDMEIASRLAVHYGAEFTVFRRPGMRKCQSMLAGKLAHSEAGMPQGAYYGFPIE